MTGVEGGIGVATGIVVKFLWDKFNGDYLSKKDFEEFCKGCNAKSAKDVAIIRKVVLKLAANSGISVKEYEDLAD